MDKQVGAGLVQSNRLAEHQQQIDAIQAAIRGEEAAARPNLFKPPPPRPAPSADPMDHRIAEELDYIVRKLEQLGGTLATDPILLHRHSYELQSIDMMKQTLGHLARIVAAQDKALAAGQVTLTELKSRLQRKALKPIGGSAPAP